MKYARFTYEKCHLRALDHLILLLKSGKSAQSSLKIVLSTFTSWEKLIFTPFESIFELQKNEKLNYFDVNPLYFSEIEIILKSNHQIVELLKSFRAALKIRYNMRHKSRQVTQQIRAQAIVSIFIFALLLFISFEYLNLRQSMGILFLSTALFVAGVGLIFLVGGRIRWKT